MKMGTIRDASEKTVSFATVNILTAEIADLKAALKGDSERIAKIIKLEAEREGKVLIRRDHAGDVVEFLKLMQRKYINKGKVCITDIGNVNECIIVAIEQALKAEPAEPEIEH